MFIAMNRFQVASGKDDDFERIWREREAYLDAVPGFVRFALLRGENASMSRTRPGPRATP